MCQLLIVARQSDSSAIGDGYHSFELHQVTRKTPEFPPHSPYFHTKLICQAWRWICHDMSRRVMGFAGTMLTLKGKITGENSSVKPTPLAHVDTQIDVHRRKEGYHKPLSESLPEVSQYLHEEWYNIPLNTIRHLYESISRRIQVLL
ncbi:hypothetical protein TNCV_1819511 [Trichonephila clavipes]|nr:hypothetical protein TNCV_1819511 [Trichonephila clavipes]